MCCPCVACTRMDSWSVRGSVWAPACKRGCALREAARPVDRARRERHALLTGRDAKGTRRSRRRGVADHRRLVARPRATHIPACMLAPSPASASGVSPLASIVFESTVCTLAPSPAGGGLRLGRKRLGPRLHVDRFRILNLPAQFFRGFEGFEGVSY